MDYKMMVLDIDGTLMRKGYPQVTDRVAKAVKALQKKGVIVAVATGRTYFAMSGGFFLSAQNLLNHQNPGGPP